MDHLESWIQQKQQWQPPEGHIGTNTVVTGHHPFNKEYPPQGFMNFLSKNQNGNFSTFASPS
jgi:hypothetical protein